MEQVRDATSEEIAQREKGRREMAATIDRAISQGIEDVIGDAFNTVKELPESVRNATAVQILQQAVQRVNFTLDAAYEAVRRLNRGNYDQMSSSPRSY